MELFCADDDVLVSRADCAVFSVEELEPACKLAWLSAKTHDTEAVVANIAANASDLTIFFI